MKTSDKRKQKMIHILSNKREHVTADELSKTLDISTKTVYRLVKQLNEDQTIDYTIISEKGKGYRLSFNDQSKTSSTTRKTNNVLSPLDRRSKVMEELLLSSPREKNIFDLYEEFYVSENVINFDEKIISEILARYDLQLIRNNKMIKVLGAESNIRKALKEYIQSTQNISLDELKTLKEDFNRYDAEFVVRQLSVIEKRLDLVIPHPYNVNIFSHLYIFLSRFRKVGNIFSSSHLSEEEMLQMKEDPELYETANYVIENIEMFLNTKLPEIESYFLYQYLVSSRMQKETDELEKMSSIVKEVTSAFISKMEVNLHRNFNEKELYINLSKHIKPFLNRLEHGIVVKNNLHEQIKMEYTNIFLSVEDVAKEISTAFKLPHINEDEIGFLTLYFAQAIEENPEQIKAVVVCTTGIGTSELLKVKIGKKFREIEIIDVLASRNVKASLEKYPETEMIISTVQVPVDAAIPVIIVSAMLTLDDQERLEKLIERVKYEKLSH